MSGVLSEAVGDGVVRGVDGLAEYNRIRLEKMLRADKVIRDLRASQSEWILAYAIQAGGDDGPVKIGLAKSPGERLKTLQTGNHEQLRGLAAWRVAPIEEKILHRQFAHARIRGEWFHPVPDLIEYVLWEGGCYCDWGTEDDRCE